MRITGTGSTFIVLVFSTLCLTIFCLISLSAANTDKAAAEARKQTVTGYYAADLLAEHILAELTGAGTLPASIKGIDMFYSGDRAAFSCPVSEGKELYVEISLADYDILAWQTRDTVLWVTDESMPVWSGD